MTSYTSQEGKDKIMSAFGKLLSLYQQKESKVATKQEEAEKAKNQELVKKAVDYTVDNIVNGMASLQLDFGSAIDVITEKLTNESIKLEEIKKAISVERERLQQLARVRLVADALHILRQEHQERLELLEERTALTKEGINKEIEQTRKEWAKEETELKSRVAEEAEFLALQREREEADYQYEITRQRKIETDDYEEDKRQQERELAEMEGNKNKDWAEREKSLADKEAKFTENKEKIAGFEEKIKEKYNNAKGEAIKEATNKAKVEMDLIEQEWITAEEGLNFQINSLQETMEKQAVQIEELVNDLKNANAQSHSLALKAFNN